MLKRFILAASGWGVGMAAMLAWAMPAQAFYIELPQSFKTAWQILSSTNARAEEGTTSGSIAPAPVIGPAPTEQKLLPPPPIISLTEPATIVNGDQNGIAKPLPPPQDQLLEQVRNGAGEMEHKFNKLDNTFNEAERKGIRVSPEMRGKLERARRQVEPLKGADHPEDLQKSDLGELERDTQDLEQSRRQIMDDQRRLEGMRRGLKGMAQGVKMFERQIGRLGKQGVAVPAEVAEKLAQLKAALAAAQNATTAEEMETAFQEMQGLMEDLNESRQELEMLSRWPQMLKQADRQLLMVKRELKKAKKAVERLAKKEIDLSATYAQFEEAAMKLQATRDDAAAKVAAGSAQEAFDEMENDFFGQFDEVFQHQRVIEMMSNLGRFASEFKRGIAMAESRLKTLERRKIDTSEARQIFEEIKAKGNDILASLKGGDPDEDTIIATLQEMEDSRGQLEDKLGNLFGEEEARPWEKGGAQFQELRASPEAGKFMKGQ